MPEIRLDGQTPLEKQAVQVRTDFGTELALIRRNITDASIRRLHLAEAWRTARHKIQALEAQQKREADGSQQRLLDTFFAAPSDPAGVIAQRDADDRAAAAKTVDEALSLLKRAQLSKDLVLAKATLLAALLRSPEEPFWRRVVDAFKQAWPTLANDVDQVAVAVAGETPRSTSQEIANLLGSSYAFSIPPKPNELNALSDADIERLVQEFHYGASNPR